MDATGTPFSSSSTLALVMTAPEGSDTVPRMVVIGEARAMAVKAKMKLQIHLNRREKQIEH